MKIIEAAKVVEIEEGDTLGQIAQLVFGGNWRKLFDLNSETIIAEQEKRGIGPARIATLIRGAAVVPPVEAHLIYPGTLLRLTT